MSHTVRTVYEKMFTFALLKMEGDNKHFFTRETKLKKVGIKSFPSLCGEFKITYITFFKYCISIWTDRKDNAK